MVNYCCVFGCKNNSKSHPHLAYYTFPTEHERFVSWLKLIGREDINNKNKSAFRICQLHFESSNLRSVSKLDKNATPTLLLPSTSDSNLTVPKQEPPDEFEEPGTAESPVTDLFYQPLQIPDDKKYVSVAEKYTKLTITENEIISILPTATWNCSTQTERRKCVYYTKACQTPAKFTKVFANKKQLQRGLAKAKDEMNNYTKTYVKSRRLQNFHDLCDKYLNEKLAQFVKMQSKLKSSSKGNRYSAEYKQFCSKLYASNPQLYPVFQDLLCLPSHRTLQRSRLANSTDDAEEEFEVDDANFPANPAYSSESEDDEGEDDEGDDDDSKMQTNELPENTNNDTNVDMATSADSSHLVSDNNQVQIIEIEIDTSKEANAELAMEQIPFTYGIQDTRK